MGPRPDAHSVGAKARTRHSRDSGNPLLPGGGLREVTGGRRSCQGHACSSWDETRKRTVSPTVVPPAAPRRGRTRDQPHPQAAGLVVHLTSEAPPAIGYPVTVAGSNVARKDVQDTRGILYRPGQRTRAHQTADQLSEAWGAVDPSARRLDPVDAVA